MPALSSKPAVDAVDRRIGQTDGRTPERYVELPLILCGQRQKY